MAISLPGQLERYEADILQQWVHLLCTECGEQYASRPKEELFVTVSQAYVANYEFIARQSLRSIDDFIDITTRAPGCRIYQCDSKSNSKTGKLLV